MSMESKEFIELMDSKYRRTGTTFEIKTETSNLFPQWKTRHGEVTLFEGSCKPIEIWIDQKFKRFGSIDAYLAKYIFKDRKLIENPRWR